VGLLHSHIPILVGVVSQRFEKAALALGVLLVLGALLSGLAGRSVVSLAAVSVIAGFVLGDGVTGAIHLDTSSAFVSELATVALIVILLRDGLEVEGEMLQSQWRLPLRKLVLAMPVTAILVALATRWLTGLSWTESCGVGARGCPPHPGL
jgi:NhaP-type Na+/H+ or K+/H+ antiporter